MTTTTMTTQPRTVTASPLLRLVLMVDGVGCVALGALMVGLTGWLESVLGLPIALLLGVGAFLVLYGAAETFVATRRTPLRVAVIALILVNVMWVLDSLIVLGAGWFSPTTTGVVTVAVLAVGVAGVAALQTYAYRRS